MDLTLHYRRRKSLAFSNPWQVWIRWKRLGHKSNFELKILIWERILTTRPLLYPHLSLVVGNGTQVLFWKTIWIGDSPLTSLYISLPYTL